MANGHGSNPQPVAPSAPQSPTDSSPAPKPSEPRCKRCMCMAAKGWLGWNGDWLFVTFASPCASCAAKQLVEYRDLDLDYETTEAAEVAFSPVTAPEAVTALLDHAKEYYEGVIQAQGIVRDKAKLLLGATSFTIGVFALAATVLKDALPNMSVGLLVVALVSLVLPASHFVRALFYAIVAITRESTCAVSTQEAVEALSSGADEYDKTKAERQLAARYRTAATTTNQWLMEPKSKVMLAQGCFKWGLLLLPLLVLEYLILVYVVGTSSMPRWAAPIIADTKSIHEKLNALDARVTAVERNTVGVDKPNVDRQFHEAERRLNVGIAEITRLATMTQAIHADVVSVRDDVASVRKELGSDLRSLTDRANELEGRLIKQTKLTESIVNELKRSASQSNPSK